MKTAKKRILERLGKLVGTGMATSRRVDAVEKERNKPSGGEEINDIKTPPETGRNQSRP